MQAASARHRTTDHFILVCSGPSCGRKNLRRRNQFATPVDPRQLWDLCPFESVYRYMCEFLSDKFESVSRVECSETLEVWINCDWSWFI